MKVKQHITYFLLFISMIMLIVPVIPHHHHSDGIICMKDDLSSDCCNRHQQPVANDDACETTECVTAHLFQNILNPGRGELHPDAPLIIQLFFEPLLAFLSQSEEKPERHFGYYFESLHGTYLTRATGLRAPPCILT